MEFKDIDERPHHFIIEVSEIRKTNLSIFAHSFEEAKKLIMDLTDEECEEKIEKNLESDGYHYNIVQEEKNNHISESQIDEYDVERNKNSSCMEKCKKLLFNPSSYLSSNSDSFSKNSNN